LPKINQDLYKLIELSSRLSQSGNVSETLRQCLEVSSRLLECDAFAFWLFVASEMEWKCEVASNLSEKYTQTSAEKYLSSSFLPAEFRRDDLIVIEDLAKIPALESLVKTEKVRSLVGIPLSVHNQRTASMVFFFRKNQKFTDEEIELVQVLKNLIGGPLASLHAIDAEKKIRLETEKTVAAKNELLRATAHRTKNTLQTISSLLSLQSKEVQDPKGRHAFEKSVTRVQTMILVHEKFYEDTARKMLSMDKYVHDLARALFDYFVTLSENISLDVESDPWGLEPELILPLGLLLNELISNSVKHAFPNRQKGTVKIRLRALSGGKFELLYSDDGIGITANFTEKSFGLRLIALLADQLGANFERVETGKGTAYRFVFSARTARHPLFFA